MKRLTVRIHCYFLLVAAAAAQCMCVMCEFVCCSKSVCECRDDDKLTTLDIYGDERASVYIDRVHTLHKYINVVDFFVCCILIRSRIELYFKNTCSQLSSDVKLMEI